MIVIEITTAHDDQMIENEMNAIENGLAVIAGAKVGHQLDIRSQTQKILMTTDVVKRDATNRRELQNALPLLFEDVTLSNRYCPNKILTLYFLSFVKVTVLRRDRAQLTRWTPILQKIAKQAKMVMKMRTLG